MKRLECGVWRCTIMAHRVEFDKDALLATADDLMTLADEFDDLYTVRVCACAARSSGLCC